MWQGIRKAQEHIRRRLAAKHSCGKGSQVLNTGRQQNWQIGKVHLYVLKKPFQKSTWKNFS